jgi:N-acetyl-beta-hexosaminidase
LSLAPFALRLPLRLPLRLLPFLLPFAFCLLPYSSRAQTALIPKPSSMVQMPGEFILGQHTVIALDNDNAGFLAVADDFVTYIQTPLGFPLKYVRRAPASNYISIKTDPSITGEEAYRLIVTTKGIDISAKSPAGLFYALQTLRQLLPSDIESRKAIARTWEIPCLTIDDSPRFEYRGFMLDVARHFQPVEVLYRYIDLLSFYKINHFHLHLTDDQGWRIEIKKYPKLQEISAWRRQSIVGHAGDKPRKYDATEHGGFYTQEQLKELVRYAQRKFITIVPEIEMPGHSTAALAAYPELACFAKKMEVTPDYGVFEDVYCTKDSTISFLEDVLAEVVDIFPGQLIHIGGDECPKTRWKACRDCQLRMKQENLKDENELQSWFIKRMQKFLNSKGRNIIGWDEIMEGGLAPGATVMYWRTWLGTGHISEIARAGFKIVMTPLDPLYFNLYENEERVITPLAYPGLIPLEKVYNYEPVPAGLSAVDARNVIGVQANLWSEYVKDGTGAEYMTFPRACALAEVAWSQPASKDYRDFINRLKINSAHLDKLSVNYSEYFRMPEQAKPPVPQNFYVDISGNDANPGTKEKPVATPEAARDLVRQYKAVNGRHPGQINVWVGKGQYDLDKSLVLNENDSGEPGSPIVWKAAEAGQVSITGGRSIAPEKFIAITDKKILKRLTVVAATKVMQVSLKDLGIRDFGQFRQFGHAIPVNPAPLELFFNHEAMKLARYPNAGDIKIGKVADPGSVPRNRDYTGRGALFTYTDQRHTRWAGQKDIWLQGTFNYGFADDNVLVETIDTISKTVKLAMPSLYGVAGGQDYQQYVALNILDELDSPGEWYLDRSSGILYFWPPSDIKGSSIMVSVLEEPVICLEGVTNINFTGFIIEAGRGIGIYMERGNANLIAGCTVRNVGTTGIFMGQGARQTVPYITHEDYEGVPVSRYAGSLQAHLYKYPAWDRGAGTSNGILSCDIYNTGSGGIVLGGGDRIQLVPGNNYVENCKIHDYNRRNKFVWAGINVDGCGNRVSHCEIYNSDYQGIFVRGNDHLFEYNNVHHVTLNSNDTSPWYIGRDPSNRGNVVRYNYFHDCGNVTRMTMGIYCDDSSTDVLVYGNVFYKMNTTHGVLFSNTGRDLKMINNIVVEPVAQTFVVSAHYYTWAANEAVPMLGENGLIRNRLLKTVNILKPPYSVRYPELVDYLNPIVEGKEWEGMRSRGNLLMRNLIVGGPENPVRLMGGKYAQCDTVNNYRTTADPGFVDYGRQNFTLRPDAEIFNKIKGFEPVPFDKMGIFADEFRKL